MHAAAAKSRQSCPTPCNPIDGSPPDSPVPGILQARTLEWVAISFSNAWKWEVPHAYMTPNRPNCQSQEQRKCYYGAKQRKQVIKAAPWGFSRRSYRQNLEWGLQDMWLSSWLVGGVIGAVFQESCVQREVIVLRLGGGLCSCRRTDRHYVYSLGRNQYPVLIAALLFLDCFFFVSAFPYFSD